MTTSKQYIFARSFARALAYSSGLNGVTLPSGIEDEEGTLVEFVRYANLRRAKLVGEDQPDAKDYVPFAILYLNSIPRQVPDFKVFYRENDLVPFRKKNRLFVGATHDLATIKNCAPITVGENFPIDVIGQKAFNLETLSKSVLDEICLMANIDTPLSDSEKFSSALENIMKILADTHKVAGAKAVAWNALWFDHINYGLMQLLNALEIIQTTINLEHFLMDSLYAAFSLPCPDAGVDKKYKTGKRNSESAVKNALEAFWGSSAEIRTSIACLKNFPEYRALAPNNDHPIDQINWMTFDETAISRRVRDSDILTWAIHESQYGNRVPSFAKLTEDQFFEPRQSENRALEIVDPDDSKLVYQISGSSLFIISDAILATTDGGDLKLKTNQLNVKVPSFGGAQVTTVDAATSDARLAVKGKGRFDGSLKFNNEVYFDGTFECDLKKKGGFFNYEPKSNLVSIQIDPNDSLLGKIDNGATATYLLLPSGAVGALVFPIKENGTFEQPKVVIQNKITGVGSKWVEIESEDTEVEIKSNLKYQVLIVSPNTNASVLLNGRVVNKAAEKQVDSVDLWQTDIFSASGLDVIRIDEVEIVLSAEMDAPVNAPESPVVAAILKVNHARNSPPKEIVRDSLRGELEDFYSDLVHEDHWTSTFGHIVMPSDRLGHVKDLLPTIDGDDFIMDLEMRNRWQQVMQENVLPDLKYSPEAEAFRNAFRNLGVAQSAIRVERGSVDARQWISKTSWAHFAKDTSLLDEYLDSYTALVTKANTLNHRLSRFWATYPFSLSVWRTEGPLKVQSVLLSPLHPIRLAWLAKVEHGLRFAENSRDFCGTLEGWNFPVVGPANTQSGKLLAVPCDSGLDQIFLGWSMMVAVSIDGHEVIRPPDFAGSRRLPGVSNSGLNGNTLKDALKDFLRINPHVATLSIDLAANTAAPKLEELDKAVISEFSEWNLHERTKRGLVGGVRVYDSLNRVGARPDLANFQSEGDVTGPLTWKRYVNDPMKPIESNIRILQDSGVAVAVNEESKTSRGIVGSTPYRRFEIPEPISKVVGQEIRYLPAVKHNQVGDAFVAALSSVETSSQQIPIVSLQIQAGSPLVGSADWTVSGESMISPAALAALLSSRIDIAQMLWEWHPPFLGDGQGGEINSAIDKRSYFTLARIPKIFQLKLKERLKFLLNRDPVDSDVQDVFKVLGTRGIGLSSLLAAGGSQLTGALGFYSIFLFDSFINERQNRFIMPIDVCNPFLKSLSGGSTFGETRKLADLLVIDLYPNTICMTPIEIKFYGTNSANSMAGSLPDPGSHALEGAVEQATSSMKLLREIQKNWEVTKTSLTSGASHILKANALATFIESAMRISPSSVETDSAYKTLSSIVDGSVKICLGKPLIAYFEATQSNEKFKVGTNIASPFSAESHAEFICDPREAFKQVQTGVGPLIDSWRHALSWALACNDSGCVDSESGIEPQTTASEPSPAKPILSPAVADSVSVSGEVPVVTPDSESSEVEVLTTVPEPTPTDMSGNAQIRDLGVKFEVGKFVNSQVEFAAEFWPSNTLLSQLNIGVVGDLGTGKTQLVKALLTQLRKVSQETQPNPITALILDYKHDYQDEAFLKAVGGKVLKPFRIPLDILRIRGVDNAQSRFKKANTFIDVLTKIYGGLGHVQLDRLQSAILKSYNLKDGKPGLKDVLDEYRLVTPHADAVTSILNIFVIQEIFSPDVENSKSLAELFEDGVLVLDLRDLDPDDRTKNALVALILNEYFDYMIHLKKWPFQAKDQVQLRQLNSYLVVDEATNIMSYKFSVLMSLLLQGREYGVGVLLSSQFLSHFDLGGGLNYGEPLLTWFIHRVPNITVGQLSGIGLPAANAQDVEKVKQLPPHSVFYSSLNVHGKFVRGTPFYKLQNSVER